MPAFDVNTPPDIILERHLIDALAYHDPGLPQQQAQQLATILLHNADNTVNIASTLRGQFDLPAFGIEDGAFTLIAATAAQRRAETEFRNLIAVHLFQHLPAGQVLAANRALQDTDLWQKTWLSAYQHAAPQQYREFDQQNSGARGDPFQNAQAALAAASHLLTGTEDTPPPLQREAAAAHLDDLISAIARAGDTTPTARLEHRTRDAASALKDFSQSFNNGPWAALLAPVLNESERIAIAERVDSALGTLATAAQPLITSRLRDHQLVSEATAKALTAIEELQTRIAPTTTPTQHPSPTDLPRLLGTAHIAALTSRDAHSYDAAAESLDKALRAATAFTTTLQGRTAEDHPSRTPANDMNRNLTEATAAAMRLAHYQHDLQLLRLINIHNQSQTPAQGLYRSPEQTQAPTQQHEHQQLHASPGFAQQIDQEY